MAGRWRVPLAVTLALAGAGAWWFHLPGTNPPLPLAPATAAESALAGRLAEDVGLLASRIGERHDGRPQAMGKAADWIASELAAAGLTVGRQAYEVGARRYENIEGVLTGQSPGPSVVVVGAHYDTFMGAPGANDNGSGVAAMLAVARALADRPPLDTVRFVAFANEEHGFQTEAMGSWVYAKRCRERGQAVRAMLSLETMGYYTEVPGSQQYPMAWLGWIFPSTGHFVSVVGDPASRSLMREVVGGLREHARFPTEGAALPAAIPGVGWSDHWAFWQEGYPAVMVTDTAPFRYTHYHTPQDTPERLNYPAMARVVTGLVRVVSELAGP